MARPPRQARLEILHAAALALWLGTLVTVGVTAAVAFPTMKSLAPVLPGFRVPVEDHWSIAAGHVMNPVFFAAMIAGLALGCLALIVWKSMGNIRRTILALAILSAIATLAGLGLPMRKHLDAYWSAARTGEIETAAEAKSKFDALHPWSSRALGVQAGLVGLALVLAIALPRRDDPATPGSLPS